jgi:hypothetical protein
MTATLAYAGRANRKDGIVIKNKTEVIRNLEAKGQPIVTVAAPGFDRRLMATYKPPLVPVFVDEACDTFEPGLHANVCTLERGSRLVRVDSIRDANTNKAPADVAALLYLYEVTS